MKKHNKSSLFNQYVRDLYGKLSTASLRAASTSANQQSVAHSFVADLKDEDKRLVQQIKDQTSLHNVNNVSRTKAYLSVYLQYPEIHWSLLAHAVSRNAGWNMTDLKGEMLPRLLTQKDSLFYFQLLERCNWLIFQDAYPQLLLYEESKRRNQALFHLLPHFHVSSFMQIVWPWFWKLSRQSASAYLSKLLAFALIHNEQNYIEHRVVQDSFYQSHVLHKFTFLLQSFLHFNHVYFPCASKQPSSVEHPSAGHQGIRVQSAPHRLAGAILRDFTQIKERIAVGKTLYTILFERVDVSKDIQSWLRQTNHTGSRSDYWPHLFTATQLDAIAYAPYHFHLKKNKLHAHMPLIFSPKLEQVWKDQTHNPAERGDWYKGDVKKSWFASKKDQPFDMTNECFFALNRIEAAIVVKEKLTPSSKIQWVGMKKRKEANTFSNKRVKGGRQER